MKRTTPSIAFVSSHSFQNFDGYRIVLQNAEWINVTPG